MGIIDNSPKQLENKYNCVMISDIEVIFVNEIQFVLSKTAVVLRFKDSGAYSQDIMATPVFLSVWDTNWFLVTSKIIVSVIFRDSCVSSLDW